MEFRLKELRKERNLSQLKLAMDLDMNQNSISRYETMEREADYETLIKFAKESASDEKYFSINNMPKLINKVIINMIFFFLRVFC